MPIYEDYYSDASWSSDTESEGDEAEEDLYDPRDTEYWAIEALFEKRKPPPSIEYLCDLTGFDARECVVGPNRNDIESVVDSKSAWSWHTFWRREEQRTHARFSHDDWDAIGEFAMELCECCFDSPDTNQIKSCIIRILSHGRFAPVQPYAVLPLVRRRR